jgi:hypothetical protein
VTKQADSLPCAGVPGVASLLSVETGDAPGNDGGPAPPIGLRAEAGVSEGGCEVSNFDISQRGRVAPVEQTSPPRGENGDDSEASTVGKGADGLVTGWHAQGVEHELTYLDGGYLRNLRFFFWSA